MIYMDHGATSFPKPYPVCRAVKEALHSCANPGRGGYWAARNADRTVFECREEAAALFGCEPEQVVFTGNCTHGLNIAIGTVVKPGMKVAVSGFEHNAVLRPLYALGAETVVCGRKLFDPEDTLGDFRAALGAGAQAVVCTHVSNVFGYVLPLEAIGALCRERKVPLIVDAAQSAGVLPLSLKNLGASFIAMPGHKGLLGPQGTGLLLCGEKGRPLLFGGTGTASREKTMPEELPERLEPGTLNVPGIAGLREGLRYVRQQGPENLLCREHGALEEAAEILKAQDFTVFRGPHQAGTLSFLPDGDCQVFADFLSGRGIGVRAGLHCAPLAHESAGTLDTGTVRLSFGWNTERRHLSALRHAIGVLKSAGRQGRIYPAGE